MDDFHLKGKGLCYNFTCLLKIPHPHLAGLLVVVALLPSVVVRLLLLKSGRIRETTSFIGLECTLFSKIGMRLWECSSVLIVGGACDTSGGGGLSSSVG